MIRPGGTSRREEPLGILKGSQQKETGLERVDAANHSSLV